MTSKKLAASLFTVLGLSAFAIVGIAEISDQNKGEAQSAQEKPIDTLPHDNQVKEKLRDDTFVEQAALSGMAEVELSKLAISKTQNQKLKNFATATLKEQTAANAKLQQVAGQSRLELPVKLNAAYLSVINELKALSGAQFDKAFINIMKKNQDTVVALFDNAAGEPTLNVDLRVFANQALPVLRARQESTHTLIDSSDKLSQR